MVELPAEKIMSGLLDLIRNNADKITTDHLEFLANNLPDAYGWPDVMRIAVKRIRDLERRYEYGP